MAEERVLILSVAQLRALQDLAVQLNSTLNLREVLERALMSAEDFLRAEASSIFLREPTTGDLTFYALTGEKRAVLEGVQIPRGKGVVGWVVENRQSARIADVQNDPRFFRKIDEQSGFRTRSLLCVPLAAKDKILGALEVVNRKDSGGFAEEHLLFLEILGSHVAAALDNALLYQELSQAHEALKKLDEMKSNFIAVASHELRTPVTLIQSFHELLKTEMLGPLQPKQKEALGRMGASIAWLNRVVTNVTNIASLDRRQVQPQVQSFDLATLIREVAVEMEPFFEQRRQRFSTKGTGKEVKVRGDPDQIRQVLRNLLLNAIRFTPDGGSLGVTLEASEFGVRVAVSDTGIGIPRAEFDRIFERFHEVQSAATHSSGTIEFKSAGLGLGLAIAKRIVELHRGRIWVESEVGKGSTVYFTLPRQS